MDLGLRQDTAALVKFNVKQLMVAILSDEVFHAEVVAAGPFAFRAAFGKDMGAFFLNNQAGCDHLANVVMAMAEQKWHERHPGVSPGDWLDAYSPPSPITEAEIDAAWELEIGGSESALRQLYEGSCRTRKGADLGSRRFH